MCGIAQELLPLWHSKIFVLIAVHKCANVILDACNVAPPRFFYSGRIDPQPDWQPKRAADVRGVSRTREKCRVTAVSPFVCVRRVFHA